MVRVVIVLDGLVRDSLVQLMREHADLHVSSTDSMADVDSRLGVGSPTVVITDADRFRRMKGRRGFDRGGSRPLVRVRPTEQDRVADALVDGATGLFTDRTPGPDILEAVRCLAAGQGWLAPDLVPLLLRDHLPYFRRRAAARQHLDSLGNKDLRLLGLVADGKTNAEIAVELNLAISTVKDYVADLLSRLSVTRPEAIALAIRADLVAEDR